MTVTFFSGFICLEQGDRTTQVDRGRIYFLSSLALDPRRIRSAISTNGKTFSTRRYTVKISSDFVTAEDSDDFIFN